MRQETAPLGIGSLFMASGMVFVAVASVLFSLGPPPVGGHVAHMLYALCTVLGALAASCAVWGALGRDGGVLWAAMVCGVIAGLLLAGSWLV